MPRRFEQARCAVCGRPLDRRSCVHVNVERKSVDLVRQDYGWTQTPVRKARSERMTPVRYVCEACAGKVIEKLEEVCHG